MRKILVTEFYALDGVMEAPHEWPKGYWNDEIEKYKLDELFASEALLLGRVTYDEFAQAWPSMTDEAGFAEKMNSLPKYVVSTTLDKPGWNNSTLIKENVVEEIKKLKQQSGGDIMIHGSSELINSLLPHNVIDEFRLLLYPFVLGKGKHLFSDGSKVELKLMETKTFSTGVIALHYQTARNEKK